MSRQRHGPLQYPLHRVFDRPGSGNRIILRRAPLWAFHVNACSPADDHAFNALARFHILPIPATPSTREGNQIRADVILAKQLERLIRWWFAFMSERIYALLPRCHRLYQWSDSEVREPISRTMHTNFGFGAPCTHKSGSVSVARCPLRSESDQIAARLQNDAMCHKRTYAQQQDVTRSPRRQARAICPELSGRAPWPFWR
jgi:hypothetical protein